MRRATTDDITELLRLGEQWLNPLWNKEDKKKILHLELLFSTNHMVYVTEKEGKLVGFADILFWYDWLTKKTRLLIQHMYVDESYRNQGIGTKLLQFILDIHKPDYSLVDTKPEKFPLAENLYKELGFKYNPNRLWLEMYAD